MKKTLTTLVVMMGLWLMWSCNSHKIIPDRELAQIFHDAMLVNAYINNDVGQSAIDSVNFYEPIFAKYGYTVEDFHYTMDKFSRRKSSRLSDVAEVMLLLLDRESQELASQVEKLDTIENVARRRYRETLLERKNIVVKESADTAKLNFELSGIRPGKYAITGYYTLPKPDKLSNRRAYINAFRKDSTRRQMINSVMFPRDSSNFNYQFDVESPEMERLTITFNHFVEEKERPKKPNLTIHSLKIEYTPTLEVCVERLFNEQSGMRIFADTMLHMANPKTENN